MRGLKLYVRKEYATIKQSADKAIEIIIESDMCHLLNEVTRKNGEEGYKVSATHIGEELKKYLYRGSESMTSTTGGKSYRYRFIALSNISDQIHQKVLSIKHSFVSYFNSAAKTNKEEKKEAGNVLMSAFAAER